MLDKLELLLSILVCFALLDLLLKLDKDGILDRLLSRTDGTRTITYTGWKQVFMILCFVLPPVIGTFVPSPFNFVILTAIAAAYLGYLFGRKKGSK